MAEKRNTHQKRMILDTLCEMKNHPTANMVYERLQEMGSHISKSTVYRNLSEAAEDGIILKLAITDSDVRYDGNTKPHYHIRCRKCTGVYDSKIPYQDYIDELSRKEDGETISCHMIEFNGICRECKERMEDN